MSDYSSRATASASQRRFPIRAGDQAGTRIACPTFKGAKR